MTKDELKDIYNNSEDPDLLWFKKTMNIKSSNPIEDFVQAKLRERSIMEQILPCVKVK